MSSGDRVPGFSSQPTTDTTMSRSRQQSGAAANPYQTATSSAVPPSRASVSPPPAHSLDSSSIFERNVQEPTVIPSEIAPAIPAHIKTEDQIPPALEASSLAITDSHLRPDEVEIVTHAIHQPASTTIAEGTTSAIHSQTQLPLSPPESHHESFASTLRQETDDSASNYASLDPTDVRRLSFISFADVVQAEHASSMPKDGGHHVPQSPLSNPPHSPGKSPVSPLAPTISHEQPATPQFGSLPGSMKGVELGAGYPSPANSPQQHGELTIQTMSQALRKTASGDLGVGRSPPISATAMEDAGPERHPLR